MNLKQFISTFFDRSLGGWKNEDSGQSMEQLIAEGYGAGRHTPISKDRGINVHVPTGAEVEEIRRCGQLFSNIDGKSLDAQQRVAAVCDEDRNLVLAGAGAGKTLTIAGKVMYLCREKNVDPKDMLLIAFTRKSAEEMTSRISDRCGISLQATTFHKLGLDILTSAEGKRPEVFDDISGFVKDYFEKYVVHNPAVIKKIIEYFAYYLHIPADMNQYKTLGEAFDREKGSDLETFRSKYDRQKQKLVERAIKERSEERITLRNEKVKSLEELVIANFLYLHGITYEYESFYPHQADDAAHKAYRPDFYLPDYNIYLEHFGINKKGETPWLSQVESKKYRESMEWKRALHKKNGTKLLETYSYYSSEGCLLEKLTAMLKANGVAFREPDFNDIFNTIYGTASDKYLSEFIRLCTTFICLFKSNGYDTAELSRLQNRNPKHQTVYHLRRTGLFMEIISSILNAYNAHLEETGSVDFSDMINKAAWHITEGFTIHSYKWIIIDEYQDISVARYRLIKAILDQTGAKLLCVGDDWQSIYRFAGSDISLFTDFQKYFGKTAIMKIENTYRNSQQLVVEAGAFVMRNRSQYRKQLHSNRTIEYPLVFMCYKDNPSAVLKRSIDKIISSAGNNSSILLLGRTNYDLDVAKASGLFSVSENRKLTYNAFPEVTVLFMTIHEAKGLEADNVILLNFRNDVLGFPNKIADDPVLELVLTAKETYPYAEERRLLYVALTRTRNRVYILVDEKNPSEFFSEFKSSKFVFIFRTKEKQEETAKVKCPRCKTGELMQRKNDRTHKGFVGCSNYPRCEYSTPDLSVLTDPQYCPQCGGFLTKRKGVRGFFYGCSNYPYCRYTKEVLKV